MNKRNRISEVPPLMPFFFSSSQIYTRSVIEPLPPAPAKDAPPSPVSPPPAEGGSAAPATSSTTPQAADKNRKKKMSDEEILEKLRKRRVQFPRNAS